MVGELQRSVAETSDMTLPYRSLVGSLMFLGTQTRPDVAYSVGMLARHSDNYQQEHFKAAKRVLRYLVTTKDRMWR